MDFRKNPPPLQPLITKGTEVERADSYRFLELQVTSDQTDWTLNTAAIVKKAQQRLYVRLLRKPGLKCYPLTQAYRGLIESTLITGITDWYGNTTTAERKALQGVIKTAERITGTKLPSMDSVYMQRCHKRAENHQRLSPPSPLQHSCKHYTQPQTQQSGQHHYTQHDYSTTRAITPHYPTLLLMYNTMC